MHTAYLLVSCRSDLRNSSVVEDDDRTVLAKPVQQQRIDVVHPLAKVLHEDQGHARLPAHVPVRTGQTSTLARAGDSRPLTLYHHWNRALLSVVGALTGRTDFTQLAERWNPAHLSRIERVAIYSAFLAT